MNVHQQGRTTDIWWIVAGAGAVLVLVLALRFMLAAAPEAGFIAVDEEMRRLLQERDDETGSAAASTGKGPAKPGTVAGTAKSGAGSPAQGQREAAAGAGAGTPGGAGGTTAGTAPGTAQSENGAAENPAGGAMKELGSAGPALTDAGIGAGAQNVGVGGSAAAVQQPGTPAMATETGASSGGKLDLNRATAEQLVALPGIGPSKAQAILELRKKLGGFRSVDQLKQVKGIGAQTFKKLEPLITVAP
ncbi:helix-hairpin-helix domain-containing protein [Paenibacillus filicis]|uniref:Helix-hairpin-helix domain-containing protein n=1 Tax=Paenibacillus filicis TaxID=669464 RepID=A0ABU9DNQ1_9BACL